MDRRPILIHDARIVNEGVTARGYVLIEGDVIADTAAGDAPAALMQRDDLEKIDAAGRLLMPGVIDGHVHSAIRDSRTRPTWPPRAARLWPEA